MNPSSSRRKFIVQAALAAPALMTAFNSTEMPDKNIFVHHVYFWLKDPASTADRNKLVAGLKTGL
jgi:hypothetical protein